MAKKARELDLVTTCSSVIGYNPKQRWDNRI
jgi:hypothetical protein